MSNYWCAHVVSYSWKGYQVFRRTRASLALTFATYLAIDLTKLKLVVQPKKYFSSDNTSLIGMYCYSGDYLTVQEISTLQALFYNY